MVTDLRYPVGRFADPGEFSPQLRDRFFAEIAACPAEMRRAVAGLDEAQLDTPYREGGWTVRQVVHHVPDSHMNAYIRHKLAVVEDHPTIKTYDEAVWAALPDGATGDIECSLRLLEALHERWLRFLRARSAADFARAFFHPEAKRDYTLFSSVGLYAWHSRHHVAHITSLRARMRW